MLDTQELLSSECFLLLITKGQFSNVKHKIKCRLKWRGMIGILCERSAPQRLKECFYRTSLEHYSIYASAMMNEWTYHKDKFQDTI